MNIWDFEQISLNTMKCIIFFLKIGQSPSFKIFPFGQSVSVEVFSSIWLGIAGNMWLLSEKVQGERKQHGRPIYVIPSGGLNNFRLHSLPHSIWKNHQGGHVVFICFNITKFLVQMSEYSTTNLYSVSSDIQDDFIVMINCSRKDNNNKCRLNVRGCFR